MATSMIENDCLGSEKQAITWEKNVSVKPAFYKPLEFSKDMDGKFNLWHTRRTLALEW